MTKKDTVGRLSQLVTRFELQDRPDDADTMRAAIEHLTDHQECCGYGGVVVLEKRRADRLQATLTEIARLSKLQRDALQDLYEDYQRGQT